LRCRDFIVTKTLPASENADQLNIRQEVSGHRQRLRQRFLTASRSIPDYELMELLLFYIFPRKDTKPQAKALMNQCGSLRSIIFANDNVIKKVNGCGSSVSFLMKLLKEIICRISLETVKKERIISSNIHVIEYYQKLLSLEQKEQFRAMFLNTRGKLISEEQLQHGTIDQTPIYPREVMQLALEYGASAIILVHNHPSGIAKPSRQDISITKQLVDIAEKLEIQVLDHIIISRNESFSFAEHKLLSN